MEDEPALLVLLTVVLESAGYAVLGVADAHAALRLARADAPEISLLVTDLRCRE